VKPKEIIKNSVSEYFYPLMFLLSKIPVILKFVLFGKKSDNGE